MATYSAPIETNSTSALGDEAFVAHRFSSEKPGYAPERWVVSAALAGCGESSVTGLSETTRQSQHSGCDIWSRDCNAGQKPGWSNALVRSAARAPISSNPVFRIVSVLPLTDLPGLTDHLLELAAKLPREAGLP
jgi:hypothetical protein